MSMQIAVRLPDKMVEQLDQVVASGRSPSRTALVTSALEREIRRLIAEKDAARIREVGAVDDLDGLVDWSLGAIEIESLDA